MSDENWTEAASAVWQLYEAMAVSKDEHLAYLQKMEDKYSKYGGPNEQEQADLDRLLDAHDANVKGFRGGLAQLRIDDPKAYAALVMRLSAQA